MDKCFSWRHVYIYIQNDTIYHNNTLVLWNWMTEVGLVNLTKRF
eukprot:UN16189